ncbi:DNA end protector [Vibrio phage EniLVp02]
MNQKTRSKHVKNKAAMKAIIDDFRSKTKIAVQKPTKAAKKSEEWIKVQMKRVKYHRVARMQVGKIYMFGYDAKYKDKLPYWDRYPLVVCIGVSGKHMLGLNLHYIPPAARAKFLENLLRYANTKLISNNTRLRIDWSKVKAFRGAHHMIKMYLASHVRMGMMEVNPRDWHNVIWLQTQQFEAKGRRISAVRVYNDYSRR